jgi:ATPase involved in DNA repair
LIDAGADQLKKLEAAAAEAGKRFSAAAAKLSAARTKAAEKLDRTVNAELAPLKLERATFTTQIESDPNRRARRASTASSSGSRPIPAPGRGP